MKHLLKLLSPALFLLCLFYAPEARADNVVITGGSVNQGSLDYTYHFVGDNFEVRGFGPFGRTPCNPCRAGEVVQMSTGFAGESSLRWGPATINGVSYDKLFYGGAVEFSVADFIVPPEGLPSTVIMPFKFNGFMSGYLVNPFSDCPCTPVFTTTLTGQGFVTLELTIRDDPFLGRLHSFKSITYTFQPAEVPEPATLLLLGTGLAGVAASARRRKSAREALKKET
ncbi:MAG TPA: PEP-CTERM sorting domain-containing protein [Pyrinomonadaceae bacterium]|jgi:hypothetical protein